MNNSIPEDEVDFKTLSKRARQVIIEILIDDFDNGGKIYKLRNCGIATVSEIRSLVINSRWEREGAFKTMPPLSK